MPSQASSRIATTIGQNIRAARGSAKLTQRALAEKVDVDPMLVSKWERGWHKPSDENLTLVALYTGRDLGWFYTQHRNRGGA